MTSAGRRIQDLYTRPVFVDQGSAHISDVYSTLALPLTMGIGGVYPPGSQIFSQFDSRDANARLTREALQFFCCVAEDGTQGTPHIRGLKRSDPRYARAVAAIWRKRQNRPSMVGDRELIQKFVVNSVQFDPILADIYFKMTNLSVDRKKWNAWEKQHDERLANNNNNNDDGDEAIEVPHEVAVQEDGGGGGGGPQPPQLPPKKKKGRKSKIDYHAAYVRHRLKELVVAEPEPGAFDYLDDPEDDRGKVTALDTEAIPVDRIDCYFVTIPRGEDRPSVVRRIASPDSADDGGIMLDEDELRELLADANGDNGGGEEEEEEEESDIVGGIVLMYIKDKNFNSGQTLLNIIETQERRCAHLANNQPNSKRTASRRSNYEEPYAHLYPFDNHFVWNASPSRFNTMLDWVYNTNQYSNSASFVSPLLPIVDGLVKNPAHPENMFTLERALNVMRAFGGNTTHCNFYTWLDHSHCGFAPECNYQRMRTRCYRLSRAAHTYKYRQYKMIWGTNAVTGLAYEYFPHIDTEFHIEDFLPANHRQNQVLQPAAAAEQQNRERAIVPSQELLDVFYAKRVVNGQLVESQTPMTRELANQSRIHWRSIQHEHNAGVIEVIKKELMPNKDALHCDSHEYQAYAVAMTAARRHLLTISGQFFVPNKEILSDSMNTIYDWFYTNCKDSVGTFIPQYVHGMDVLGNWWVLDGQITRHDTGIVRYVTRYLLMHWAAHDVYRQHASIPMHPGFWNYGPGKAGKLYTFSLSLSLLFLSTNQCMCT